MFLYNLRLSLISIRKNPIISSLMIAAIAIGIGSFMTTYTVYYFMSGNPIPHKSEHLYAVQLDSWSEREDPVEGPKDIHPQITYIDGINLMKLDTPAKNQVMMTRMAGILKPENDDITPYTIRVRATYGSFFSMFDTPFQYGNGWQRMDDDNKEQVIVISHETNEKLFGGENSVGKKIHIGDYYYKVIGVLKDWDPTPKFYDLTNFTFANSEDIYIPLTTAIQHQFRNNGNTDCWQARDPGYEAFIQSECVWIQMWAELENENQAEAYLNFLNNYTDEQKRAGRFPSARNNFITPVMEWIEVNDVVTEDSTILVGLALMFFLVCLINTAGLLLAKFVGRAPEVSLKRALGASKKNIFKQYLVEVSLLGLLGGLSGLLLSYIGLQVVDKLYIGYERLVSLDLKLVAITLFVSIIASGLAGLYPSWRICQLPPARYLKTQ